MLPHKVLWISTAESSKAPIHEFSGLDFNIEFCGGLAHLRAALDESPADCVVIEGPVAELDRADCMEAVHSIYRNIPVVFWDAEMSAGEAARLVRAGAFDCIGYRDGLEALHDVMSRAVEHGHHCIPSDDRREPWRDLLIGHSRAMETVAETIRLVGPRRCTVLITGESGTGKEVAARAIHAASPRASHPMVAVNCTALPENLLEAELFGHVKGAFTGAANVRIGRFEQAQGGTIFLDEIGDMPVELQAKLLRVLQEREIQRLGSSETIRVDVRVIAATNVNLLDRVRQGRFREDLYYRLNVVPFEMPPLRQHTGDIPELVHHFVRKVCAMEGIPEKQVSPEAIERLKTRPWPGNVRQLENAVEMAVTFGCDNQMLTASDFRLPNPVAHDLIRRQTPLMLEACDETGNFDSAVSHFERTMIERAMHRACGNKTAAAELLGLKRTTLIMKLRSFEQSAAMRAS